jgi:hypothetical protein
MQTTIDTKNFQSAGVPSNYTVATADGTVFTLAKGEVGFIQNLDDAALAVKFGATASTTSFNVILQAGSAAGYGTGGFIYVTDYVGVVSVAATSGTPNYIAWKRVLA